MFNYFDIIVAVLIILTGVLGYHTGIIASLFYVSSGFAGMWAAETYAKSWGVNFYLVFFAAALLVILLGTLMSHLLKKIMLGKPDRFGGAVLGIVLGLVITGIVLVPVSHKMPAKTRRAVLSSFSATQVVPVLRRVFPTIEEFKVDAITESLRLPELPGKSRR